MTIRQCGSLALFGILFAFATQAGAAQEHEALSLSQAVTAALENHPSMRAAHLAVESAGTRVDEARGGRLPMLRVSETITRGNNPVFVFGSLLEQARFGPQNFSLLALNNPESITNLRTSLSATLPVFDGMKASSRIAQANIGRKQAELHRSQTQQQVRFQVIREYSAVVVAQAALEVAEEAVRLAESDVQRTRDRLDAGLAVESDLLAAQVQLAEFKQQRIQTGGNAATAAAALNISIGAPIGRKYRLTDDLQKKAFDVPGPDELFEQAIRQRAQHESAESAIEFAARGVTERRSEYLPELHAFGSVGSSGSGITSGSMDYSVGLGLTLNLFDRGRAARVEEARLRQQTAETERDRVTDQIRLEVIGAYHVFRAAEEQLHVAESTLGHAVEALRIIQDRYQEGLTTITDVLRAQTAAVRARLNVISSRQAHYLGYANVLLATGELNDVRAFAP